MCAASWTFPSLFVARRGKHSAEKLRHRRGDFARLACTLCARATASRGADLRVAAVSVSQTAAGLSRMLRFGKVQSCTSAGSYFFGRRWIDGVERFRSTDHESCRRERSAVKEWQGSAARRVSNPRRTTSTAVTYRTRRLLQSRVDGAGHGSFYLAVQGQSGRTDRRHSENYLYHPRGLSFHFPREDVCN